MYMPEMPEADVRKVGNAVLVPAKDL